MNHNNYKMNELSLQEQKQVALDILSEIDEICKKNRFKYSLAYGTLLGAVRHKGFIPWDDDIDIMMPRADYEKFIEYCKYEHTGFSLASYATDPQYGYIFSKACDKGTVVVPQNMKWKKHGIQVDIFPIEKLGKDLQAAKRKYASKRFAQELFVAWNWQRFEKNPHKTLPWNVAKFGMFCISRFVSNKRLIKSIHHHYRNPSFEDGEYVGIICGAYRQREIMHSSIYEEYEDIVFEGKTFRSISKWHEYLTTVYGDYMQLPPEEKRVTHHSFKAYWKE